MEKVLVTGVAGFIGSHVAEHAQKLRFEVVGVDDLSGGFERNVPAGVKFVRGDVADPDVVARLWSEHGPFAYVYHLAAYAAEGLSHFIRRFNYENNVLASMNIINQCLNAETRCLVFTSSIAVYGRNQLPMTEDMRPKPEDPYGIAKYSVELDLAAAHEIFGLNYIVFRPHNVYGERQNIADRYRNVVGIFMNQVMQGKPMTVFGDGMQTRAFSHIDNVAPIIASAATLTTAYNQVFNIGADKPHTVLELAQIVASAFGVEPKVEHLPARQEVVHAFSDHSKLLRYFGQTELVPLRTGVERMVAWARGIGPMTPVTFHGIEVKRNLPPSWRMR
jgi:UDP-glucose 4-epimerase